MKRTLACLLALLLVAALAPAVSASGSAPEEKYTYTIVQHLPSALMEEPPMIGYWEEVFGVNFVVEHIEQSKINELMALRFASGDIPDVITNLGYAMNFELVNQGIVGTWTEEFMRQHAPDVCTYIDELGPDAWSQAKHRSNGEVFCTPGVNPSYMYGMAIIWRDSWLEAIGEEIPTTLEDAERVFYKFANEDPDGNGAKDTFGLSKTGMNQVYGAYGVPLNTWIKNEDEKLVYANVAPAMKDALAKLAQWYADGVLDPEFITGENKGDYQFLSHAFCQGRIGYSSMGVYSHWFGMSVLNFEGVKPSVNLELFLQLNPDDSFSYGWPLAGPNGDTFTGVNSYAFWSVYAKDMTDNEGKFAKWWEIFQTLGGFTNPSDYLTTLMGIEGEHWDYNEFGIPVNHEGVDRQTIGAGNAFTFSNNHHATLLTNPVLASVRDEIYANDPTRYSMWPNWVPIPLPSASDYQAECQKVLDEGFIAIITGEQPIDYFDEIVDRWYAVGGTILTEEANAQ